MSDLGGAGSRESRADSGDALAVLAWGLRRYWWIIVLSVCAFGIGVPLQLERAPETYDAQAQVGPTAPLNLQNIDPLPRLGQSLFDNGSVAEAVRQSFDPPLPASEDVIPQRVSLVTAQDNLVLTVVGHASDPDDAANLANVGAETLADELNHYEGAMGSFTTQRRALPPGGTVPRLGLAQAVAIGTVAGLVVGLGIVGLLLVRRRPVLTVESAEAATGARVLGSVWLGSTVGEARGLPQLCHAVLALDCEELLLAGTPRTRPHRHQLTRLLTEVLSVRREVTPIDGPSRGKARSRPHASGSDRSSRLFVAEDASQAQLATRPDRSVAVLVVPHGIGRASLVRQVQQYLDGGAAGILLVQGRRRRPHPWRRQVPTPTVSKLGTARPPANQASSRGNGPSPRATSAENERTREGG